MESLTPPTPNDPKPPEPPPPPAANPLGQAPTPPAAPAPGGKEPDDSQLSPRAWLVRNGTYLLVFVGLIAYLVYQFGPSGFLNILLAALGLSFVIFVHELGHFAVAKWCDVHVETFSIGFGPALPGCRFKWGETVYKLALFPLGGYVKMLGEGDGEEGAEENPRSFKKKKVGQRMMIISAGVVMNIILALVCFTAVFLHGKERDAAVIGNVDPGGEAWKQGLHSGYELLQVGNRKASPDYRPLYWNDLLSTVLGSYWNDELTIKWKVYEPVGEAGQKPVDGQTEVRPPRDEEGGRPVLGVLSAQIPELPASKDKPADFDHPPVILHSAAGNARTVDLRHGDVVVAVTDANGAWTELKPVVKVGEGDQAPLARAWYEAEGKPLKLKVMRAGTEKSDELDAEPIAFRWGDKIVAATNPEKGWQLDALPLDPRNPDAEKLGRHDYFAMWRRLKLTAGQFLTVKVKHEDGSEADLTLPPAYALTLGVKPSVGQVTATRTGSVAEKMGVREHDILKQVHLKEAGGEEKAFELTAKGTDPLKLPHDVQEWAYGHKGVKVQLVVLRDNPETQKARAEKRLPDPEEGDKKEWADWDYSDLLRFSKETPGGPSSSLSIPALGLAYRVETKVAAVDSLASKAGVQVDDQITKVTVHYSASGKEDKELSRELKKGDEWAGTFFGELQGLEKRDVTLELARPSGAQKVTVTAEPDYDWPVAERGFVFIKDSRTQRASGLLQAAQMGLEDTGNTIADVYYVIRGLVTGRLRVDKTLGGPLTIGVVAYKSAGMGFWELVYFLALISANLAVINFLPIPFLDGGHMVFLIFEKLRGKPVPEKLQAVLTYAGLLALLGLMGTVIVLDVLRIWFW